MIVNLCCSICCCTATNYSRGLASDQNQQINLDHCLKMSLSAPNSPPRRPSISTPASFSVSPSLLRIAGILPDRARSLTPSNMRIRKRVPENSTVEDAVDLIRDSDNIVVLAGAGISTSVGIPDFRSAQGRLSGSIPFNRDMAY